MKNQIYCDSQYALIQFNAIGELIHNREYDEAVASMEKLISEMNDGQKLQFETVSYLVATCPCCKQALEVMNEDVLKITCQCCNNVYQVIGRS